MAAWQEVGEGALETVPGVAARLVEGQFSLMQDERPVSQLERPRHMVGGHDDDSALATMGLKERFQQIHAAAIEDAVGFVQEQKSWIEQAPFGDRKAALHAAGKGADVFARPALQSHS